MDPAYAGVKACKEDVKSDTAAESSVATLIAKVKDEEMDVDEQKVTEPMTGPQKGSKDWVVAVKDEDCEQAVGYGGQEVKKMMEAHALWLMKVGAPRVKDILGNMVEYA